MAVQEMELAQAWGVWGAMGPMGGSFSGGMPGGMSGGMAGGTNMPGSAACPPSGAALPDIDRSEAGSRALK